MNKIFCFLFIFIFYSCLSANSIMTDSFIDEILKNEVVEKPYVNTNYNYESFEKIPVKLQILKRIYTKNEGVFDGQKVLFKVKEDVIHNNKIIAKKGTIVKARVQTSMTRGMNGIPASIIIDEFVVPDVENSKLKGLFIKKGLDLSSCVFPLKWALTPIPGAGTLTNFIIGFNAKITEKNTVVIYYYPNWR